MLSDSILTEQQLLQMLNVFSNHKSFSLKSLTGYSYVRNYIFMQKSNCSLDLHKRKVNEEIDTKQVSVMK